MSVSGISGVNFSNTEAMNEYCTLLDTLTKYGNHSDGFPPLFAAIKANDSEAIRLLLKHGASPNAHVLPNSMHSDMFTALDCAAAYGNRGIINLLIDAGAKINQEPGNSPLLMSVMHNNTETLKALVDRGADQFTKVFGMTLYDFAIQKGAKDAAVLLLSLGVNPENKIKPI